MGKYFFKGDNDWNIWARKWFGAVVIPSAIALATATANYMQLNPLPIKDPAWMWVAGFIPLVILNLINLIKHA